jgi:hypothetical protein
MKRGDAPRTGGFRIFKQGELDYACGLYCLLSAARHLGTFPHDDPFPRWARAAGYGVMKDGFRADRLAVLAAGVGLRFGRAVRTVASLTAERIWLTAAKLPFFAPSGVAYREDHYVLIVGRTPSGRLVLADPHPWNRDRYTLSERAFDRFWQESWQGRWAVPLRPARRVV